jgi:hypothetical protein
LAIAALLALIAALSLRRLLLGSRPKVIVQAQATAPAKVRGGH